jgi:predicted DNA repair protein MutK
MKRQNNSSFSYNRITVSTGLIALLDDIAALAKLAAVALDDTTTQAAQAGSKAMSKAVGIVIDDAAVTPRYVVGLLAERELPIIARIATGSLRNKIFFLLPAALLLSSFLPASITPLLMFGATFLCYEGWHKLADILGLHGKNNLKALADKKNESEYGLSPTVIEQLRVKSAIRTDFILSAEIMAITLATVSDSPLWMQAVVLAVSGLGMTIIVYGAVAIIVKADDFGAMLASQSNVMPRLVGKGIVLGMPIFLNLLSHIGMLAMLWVGGGILLHGFHELGFHAPEDWINNLANSLSNIAAGIISWLVKAGFAAIVGLIVGAIVEPLLNKVLLPLLAFTKGLLRKPV